MGQPEEFISAGRRRNDVAAEAFIHELEEKSVADVRGRPDDRDAEVVIGCDVETRHAVVVGDFTRVDAFHPRVLHAPVDSGRNVTDGIDYVLGVEIGPVGHDLAEGMHGEAPELDRENRPAGRV